MYPRHSNPCRYCSIATKNSSDSELWIPTVDRILVEILCDQDEMLLVPLFASLRSELHILQKLLLVQQALVNFNFKECVTALYVSHKHLQRWKTFNSEHVPLVCVRAVLLVALTRPWQPKAHGWLECFQSTLLSKATMFFHLPFSRQEASIGGNMQRWCACTRHNLSARMDTFAQTMDASVSLVLDAQGLLSTPEEMYLHYCCPNVQSVGEECTGLQLWPMIFCSSNKSISERDHWPNVISLIMHHDLMQRATTSAPYYHFEPHIGTTYFLTNVEKRVLLVCIMAGKRNPTDPAILEFVTYLQSNLSNRSVYMEL